MESAVRDGNKSSTKMPIEILSDLTKMGGTTPFAVLPPALENHIWLE